MRLAAVALLTVLAATGLAAPPPHDAPAPVQWVSDAATWTCDDLLLDPTGDAAYDNACPTGGAIRPGVRAGGCTLSWVVTDGSDLYITTADHCDGVWRPNGIYGAVFATRLDVALEAFEAWLGRPVEVVEGDLVGVGVASVP